jgi:uncharacterized protein YecE (DUF72 family)
MSTLPLFDEPRNEFRDKLRLRLSELAAQSLFVGTSSWKYPGWMGQIYSEQRYLTRGRFSQKRFKAESLAEYGEVFPIVCGDFSFYQFPIPSFWEKLFLNMPPGLRVALKVPEEITVRVFPNHIRYGPRAGVVNPNFLNTDLLIHEFLDLLEPYRNRVSVLIFEFGTFSSASFSGTGAFLESLASLLHTLPEGWRYAVEVRNAEFLEPQYFGLLGEHNTAHVFSSWTRMPTMSQQMLVRGSFTADFTVARALLKPGRPYEGAVKQFSPYASVQEPNHEVREALRNLLIRAKRRSEPAFIFVNNRLEGNAPGTIEAVVDSL